MPRRGEEFVKGEYYHIYNRGVARGAVFFVPGNYEYCLRLIKRSMGEYAVKVIAYCLMPNHYHFLLRQEGDSSLAAFIAVVFNAYVQAVNKQQQRHGTLFEGRYRHARVDSDEYLAQLCRYIHLNPVYAGLVRQPDEWPYSNYQDWLSLRAGTLKDEALIRELWGSGEGYRRFVAEGQAEAEARERLARYVWD